jgi:hypothetical protein
MNSFLKSVISLSLTCFITISATTASAYISNYGEWRQTDISFKRGYVVGYLERAFALTTESEHWTNIQARSLFNCAEDVSLDSDMLVNAVNRAYQNDTTRWSQAPHKILGGVLHHLCLDYINKERLEYGLSPWKPWGPNW